MHLAMTPDELPAMRILQRGFAWGCGQFALAMLLCGVVKLTVPAGMQGANAGAAIFAGAPATVVMMAVLFVPLFETVVGQCLPLEPMRWLGFDRRVMVAIDGALWGLGHYLNGGLAHGLVAASSGALLAYVYLRYRSHGLGAAFAITALAHAVNNALVLSASWISGI